jgi:GNAT superfamily N-acetyltransferase
MEIHDSGMTEALMKVRRTVIIRQARVDDIPHLCDLLAELFLIESDFSPDREKQAQGLNLLIGDTSGSSAVFVAEKAGAIVGMCSVQTLISTAEGGRAGLVEDLIVRREYRGKGVGTAMLSRISSWCATREMTRLQLLCDADNAGALRFYAGDGWSATRLLCMRKHL